ncbi:MAG: right-handed parallel beta-helix repeat-containing protein [Synergistaceae bacterium]|nr:right-handed parallel beta-helix repeat-containing protein [Synergistaceae bacterium]
MSFKKRFWQGALFMLFFAIAVICGGCSGGGDSGGGNPSSSVPLAPVDFELKEGEKAEVTEYEILGNVYKIEGKYLASFDVGEVWLHERATAHNISSSRDVSPEKLASGDVVIIVPEAVTEGFFSLQLKVRGVSADGGYYKIAGEAAGIGDIFSALNAVVSLDIDGRFGSCLIQSGDEFTGAAKASGAYSTQSVGAASSWLDAIPTFETGANGAVSLKWSYIDTDAAIFARAENISVGASFSLSGASTVAVNADSINFNATIKKALASQLSPKYLFEKSFIIPQVMIPLNLTISTEPYAGVECNLTTTVAYPYASVKAYLFTFPESGERIETNYGTGGGASWDSALPDVNAAGRGGVKFKAELYVGASKKFTSDAPQIVEALFPNLIKEMPKGVSKALEFFNRLNAGLYADLGDIGAEAEYHETLFNRSFVLDWYLQHAMGYFYGDNDKALLEYRSLQYPLKYVIEPGEVTLGSGAAAKVKVYPEIIGPDGLYSWVSDNEAVAAAAKSSEESGAAEITGGGSGETTVRLQSPLAFEAACKVTVSSEAKDVFEIYTANDLSEFRLRVNSGEYGLNARLMADVDLGWQFWVAVAYYRGQFDGQGYSISGLVNNTGLFVELDGARVMNLSVTGEITGGGGIASFNNGGTIYNCSFSGNGLGGVGICETNSGVIEKCVNRATISAQNSYSGGIAGSNYGTIRNCSNYGWLRASFPVFYYHTGGICGANNNGGTVISCQNYGAVEGGNLVGGICGSGGGYESTMAISSCQNYGAVEGYDNAGGIAGSVNSRNQITGCSNHANVTSQLIHAVCDEDFNVIGYVKYCGNIAGYCGELEGPIN